MLSHWSLMAIAEAVPNSSTDQAMVAVRNPVISPWGSRPKLVTASGRAPQASAVTAC